MRQHTLSEYQPSDPIPLSIEQRDALAEMVPSLVIETVPGTSGVYVLTPGAQIGAVFLDDLSLEIRPKIPIDRVLFLISYSLDPKNWMTEGFTFGEDQSLVEAVVPGFAAQVRRATRRGLLQGYRSEDDTLMTVRGRIRFHEQIGKRFGIAPPVEVTYDDFTEDIRENRLIKAALERMRRMKLRSEFARRQLRHFDGMLQGVALEQYHPGLLPDVTYTRLNRHYEPAVELAKLILRSTSTELKRGRYNASAFLVDMNLVFESFIYIALREALGLTEREFPAQSKGHALYLDDASRIVLLPDLSWWRRHGYAFVGDVKYKRINVPGINHPDLYQLLAYTIAANVASGMLVYAAGEGVPTSHTVRFVGKQLDVTSIDLTGTPDQILRRVATLADRIRAIAGKN